MKKEFLTTLKILIAAFIITLGVNYIHAWSSPSCSPPNCNIDAPLNVSKLGQEKYGSILLDGTDQNNNPFTYGLTVLNGIVSFGGVTLPATNLKLGVVGKVGATGYCDTAGANCVAPGDSYQTVNPSLAKAVFFKNANAIYAHSPWTGSPFHKTATISVVSTNNNINPAGANLNWSTSDIATIAAAYGETRPIQSLIIAYTGVFNGSSSNDNSWYKVVLSPGGDITTTNAYGIVLNDYVPVYNSTYGRSFGGISYAPIRSSYNDVSLDVYVNPTVTAITGTMSVPLTFDVIGYITN